MQRANNCFLHRSSFSYKQWTVDTYRLVIFRLLELTYTSYFRWGLLANLCPQKLENQLYIKRLMNRQASVLPVTVLYTIFPTVKRHIAGTV